MTNNEILFIPSNASHCSFQIFSKVLIGQHSDSITEIYVAFYILIDWFLNQNL